MYIVMMSSMIIVMYGGNNLVVVSRRREIGEVETTTTGGQPERWNAGLMLWWIDSRGYDAYVRPNNLCRRAYV